MEQLRREAEILGRVLSCELAQHIDSSSNHTYATLHLGRDKASEPRTWIRVF
jgi:hypothetical protein